MSLFQSYLRSTPRTKALVGLAVLAWGGIGLAASDRVEAAWGYTATPADRAALDRALPRITVVDRAAAAGDGDVDALGSGSGNGEPSSAGQASAAERQ